MPVFGKREQRPEMRARHAQVETAQPKVESEDALMNEWRQRVQELEDKGFIDKQGRWNRKPKEWSDEAWTFAQRVHAEMRGTSAEAPAESKNEAPNSEAGELDEFKPDLEIGQVFTLEVNGEAQELRYQGDDADGKAIMVTQKGMRLFKSQGLEGVKQMAEVFPNEFAVMVDKSDLSEDKMAA